MDEALGTPVADLDAQTFTHSRLTGAPIFFKYLRLSKDICIEIIAFFWK